MRVGLVLDNPKRDLYGILLIAYQLLEKKHSVYIIPMYQQGYEIPLLGLDIVLMNYIRPNNIEYIKTYKKLGISVAVMDTEGGILSESGSDSPEVWAKSLAKLNVSKYVDRYLFWGSKVYDAFRKYSGIEKENLQITGCPRFDAFHDKWHYAFSKGNGRNILVNTNFSSINPYFTSGANDEFNAFLSAGWEEEYISEVIEQFHEIFPKFVETVKTLAIDNADKKFVIRPHPFENPHYYINEFSACRNVCVEYKKNIVDAINQASCVLHLNCGSSVESFIGNVPPISIEYLNTEILRTHTPLPGKISYRAENYNDLMYAVSNLDAIEKNCLSSEIYDEYIEPWFYKNDGDSAKRVSDAIAGITREGKYAKSSLMASIKSCLSSPRVTQILQGLVSTIFGHRLVSDFRRRRNKARNAKYSDLDEIKSIMSQIAGNDGRNIKLCHTRSPFTKARLSTLKIEAVEQ